ncbi:MAG TPA: response regulator transcription factor [Puia sp.]|jgi:DNA-binding NarL/FixJ family response regulator|nr:response regulator transcription factor [Puia sp.]
MKITIGIADDHTLFLKSLSTLINSFPSFNVILEALNGEELLSRLRTANPLPDILLLDVNMPVLNGIRTSARITRDHPSIKTIALSMKSDDTTVIGMLRSGCCAYLVKDIHPDELEKALLEVQARGYYNADAFNLSYRRLAQLAQEEMTPELSAREKQFLTHACSDLTYKEIAALMFLSERTIDGYRDALFQKLNVKSRVGMALEAIRKNLVPL